MKIVTRTSSVEGLFGKTVATVEIWNEGTLLISRTEDTMQDAAVCAVESLRNIAWQAEAQLTKIGVMR